MQWIDANGKFFTPPLMVDGVAHNAPRPELLIRAGYRPYIPKPAPVAHRRMTTSGGIVTSGGMIVAAGSTE